MHWHGGKTHSPADISTRFPISINDRNRIRSTWNHCSISSSDRENAVWTLLFSSVYWFNPDRKHVVMSPNWSALFSSLSIDFHLSLRALPQNESTAHMSLRWQWRQRRTPSPKRSTQRDRDSDPHAGKVYVTVEHGNRLLFWWITFDESFASYAHAYQRCLMTKTTTRKGEKEKENSRGIRERERDRKERLMNNLRIVVLTWSWTSSSTSSNWLVRRSLSR